MNPLYIIAVGFFLQAAGIQAHSGAVGWSVPIATTFAVYFLGGILIAFLGGSLPPKAKP